eukprot:m.306434 g.306434  ORF g.306434 m.306434 type:complete len:199 (+) comp41232_c0_seq1:116-712(+)
MAPAKGIREHLNAFLAQDNAATRAMGVVETRFKVPKMFQVYIVFGFLGLYLLFGYAAALLCNFIGVVYPAYRSCKALETDDKDDDVQWLTYWVVFAVFSIVEFFSDILLSWMPFYFLLKCVFLVWCMVPITGNGSDVIYNRVIRPYFLKYQSKVDKTIDDAKKTAGQIADKGKSVASAAGAAIVQEAVTKTLAGEKQD